MATRIAIVTLGVLFICDALRLAHRVVGPIFRFRQAIQAVTAGGEVELVGLRQDDFLQDLKTEINDMLRALEQRGAITLKKAAGAGTGAEAGAEAAGVRLTAPARRGRGYRPAGRAARARIRPIADVAPPIDRLRVGSRRPPVPGVAPAACQRPVNPVPRMAKRADTDFSPSPLAGEGVEKPRPGA
jgi:hypothetical protein